MKNWLKTLRRFWLLVKNRLWGTPVPYETVYLDELLDKLKSNAIYLIGENDFLWSAALMCPCGCGSLIQLNLLPEANPCWQVEAHDDDTITLAPSVWSRKSCGSHYFVRRGLIEWCAEN